ncbi:predicted protein [Arabidopsis lyrata subsp. lyrata]|uniref:Predicted protein n=1 Tax=Arabidopsis lyrata subsp. lyrata TaxID=81972 RepID=D7ML31_ARALL|nr:predicted protein [Arabidopsis lyrata subsp. lyrata]
MRLHEGDGIDTITTLLKQEYNITDVETRLKLTFRWPSWMLLVDEGTTRPQTIKMDNDMDLFMSMKKERRQGCNGITYALQQCEFVVPATMIHEDYVIVDLASSDSNVDSRDSSRPDPWNERLDGLMSKKISNLEVGSSSTVPTYANDENTFFDMDLSMRVFGRDTASVLDNNIVRGNDLVIYMYVLLF